MRIFIYDFISKHVHLLFYNCLLMGVLPILHWSYLSAPTRLSRIPDRSLPISPQLTNYIYLRKERSQSSSTERILPSMYILWLHLYFNNLRRQKKKNHMSDNVTENEQHFDEVMGKRFITTESQLIFYNRHFRYGETLKITPWQICWCFVI